MRKAGITETSLLQAVTEMKHGLIDADLGQHLFKKRVALPGRGKRGGARTIVATRLNHRWFFLYGFNKNERENISERELMVMQSVAQELLNLNDRQLSIAILAGQITEVSNAHDH